MSHGLSARSVYVSRLRRAFLLRVHPDRFSKSAAVTRRQQAALVQALENRLAEADFVQWQTSSSCSATASCITRTQPASPQQPQVFPFVLEKRDGTLLKASLQLGGDANVDSILDSMASALRQSGAASLPVPPLPPQQQSSSSSTFADQELQRPNSNDGGPIPYSRGTTSTGSTSKTINHQYDVHSHAGRCLATFLQSPVAASNEIQTRRRHRTDAQAVAWQVRRLFQWQAVDATPLQWSSQSVAVLFRRLLDLHAEYSNHNTNNSNNNNSKLRDSYYPLRLQFSTREPWPDEPENAALDVHAGILRLHPAHTTVQWLETLQTVTDESLTRVMDQRQRFQQHHNQVQQGLPVRLQKGFTCSSRQYHACLERWAHELMTTTLSTTTTTSATSDSLFLPAPEPVTVVVEDDSACRRRSAGEVVVTGGGGAHIRVGCGLSAAEMQHAVHQWHSQVRTAALMQAEAASQSHAAVQAALWQLGLHKVYRTATPRIITHEQWASSLQRLLATAAAAEQWKTHFSGNSLGFAAAGQFCHLADDGSLVIPHDWK